MANVNIVFPKVERVNENFTYSDLHLDLQMQQLVTNESAKIPQQQDVAADYDLGAIRNSIINIFLTSPGDKLLNPEFGIDLRDYLFLSVSDTVASSIYDDIYNNITRFEPRIVLDKLRVIPDYDNQQYTINMSISVPLLRVNEYILNLYLNSEGYVVFA
jgi:phage baseplate assembly protein W